MEFNANNYNAGNPEPEKNLESAEYRASLLRKLNCLISVVEVALAKVRVNLQTPGSDTERLTRIRLNLENTLNVCRRAKLALERKEPLPAGLPGDLSTLTAQAKKPAPKEKKPAMPPKMGPDGRPEMSYRDYVEFSSIDEFRKFKDRPAIKADELKSVDMDELARKLGGIDKMA